MIRSVRRITHGSRTTLAVLTTALAISACANDEILTTTAHAAAGVVVLDGFIQPGVTLVADTGSSITRIAFASSSEFDAGGFSLAHDTILAVSSRAAGDLLYIADVRTGTMRRLQMPAKSNPSRARLFQGTNGQSVIGVALRDSSAIALVSLVGAGSPTISRVVNAGTCPTDMFQYDNATWIVDANVNCKVNYAVQGDVRLIRVPTNGSARDTLIMTGARGSSAGAIIDGDVAYITAGGDANFASFPYTLIASGRVTKVDLKNRRILTQRSMPTNTYGAGAKLGADGFLYLSLYEDLSSFRSRVVKLRADDLSVMNGPIASWLALTGANGTETTCGSATADALGRMYCIVNGTGSVTSLVVFDPAGREIRRVAAGQGGVDLALR